MRKRSSWVGIVVSLALVVVMTVGTISARGASYTYGYYNIYYNNSDQLSWAKSLASYLNEAWRAAYSVIGNKSLKGQINLYFYSSNDGRYGYMYGGTQNMYLNRYYFSNYAKWGSTVAHETSHILFYNYLGATTWNSSSTMNYYRTFLTEALARYTGDVAYYYGANGSGRYSSAYVTSQLKYWSSKISSTYVMSWYGSGYYYKNGSGNYLNTAIWMHDAIGYFLTGGATSSTSSKVANLMYYLSSYGSYLRSTTLSTAQTYFEYSFYRATGYYANAGWIYGNDFNCPVWRDTRYLYGQFYYKYYL